MPVLMCMLVFCMNACRHGGGVERIYPHETILAIIAELKIHLERDPYTQPHGMDLNGRNIFRVSLERLDAVQEVSDFHYLDIIMFARGECLERLGEWGNARVAFRTSESFGGSLADEAGKRAGAAARMFNIRSQLNRWGQVSLAGYLNELEAIELDLRMWIGEDPLWPTTSHVRRELELIQEERIRMLFINRMSGGLDRPVEQAFELLERMADEHLQSHRLMEHWLRMGIYYETLCRDWSDANPPEGIHFHDNPSWFTWVESARSAYHRVARADGNPVKPEGRSRLRALDAYVMRISRRGR